MRTNGIGKRLGFNSLTDHIGERRAAGLPWVVLAGETGLPESTLCRRG